MHFVQSKPATQTSRGTRKVLLWLSVILSLPLSLHVVTETRRAETIFITSPKTCDREEAACRLCFLGMEKKSLAIAVTSWLSALFEEIIMASDNGGRWGGKGIGYILLAVTGAAAHNYLSI